MSTIKAVNNFVFIIRDEIQKEVDGLTLPDKSKLKPSRGEIVSIGGKVTDPDIKQGKTGIFHKGVGQEIEIDGKDYLVLFEYELIAVI